MISQSILSPFGHVFLHCYEASEAYSFLISRIKWYPYVNYFVFKLFVQCYVAVVLRF